MPKLFPILLIAIAFYPSLASAAEVITLTEIQQVAKSEAVDLAIRLLEQQQEQLKDKPEEWVAWEKQRLEFYAQNKHWQKLVERTDTLPAFVSADFIQWAMAQRTLALIALGQGESARYTLRNLIWTQSSGEQQSDLRYWRRLVIQSYLADGFASDAQTASIRLHQDYGSEETDVMLQARIALLNKRTQEAINLLKPYANKPEYQALMLLAELRGEHRPASKVMQATQKILRDKNTVEQDKANLWLVTAESAQASNNPGTAANAIEHALVAKKQISLPASIISMGNEQLWAAYLDYALYLGNQEQLLIGQDKQWLDAADKHSAKRPIGARSMYAMVMIRGQSPEVRNQAAEKFVALINKRKQGKQLLQNLFEPSSYFQTTKSIPEPIRHTLVDIALAQSDIDRASEIMATIDEPPAGSDQFMWKLRRARILVLGNQTKVGAQAVQSILAETKKFEPEQIDRLLQVVFDLQTAGEHELAYGLFADSMRYVKDDKIQRELLYWMAESRKAQERYDEAARLYLKSADHPVPDNMDPWAQTARYHAADSLAKAGLYKDAETIFAHLLRVTDDQTRRANLKVQLQKLWAMQ